MTHRLDAARGRDVVARWCAFAEQRLEYLTELFETGRWRRYHSELAFLENIQEAKTAVEIWRDLATREASRDNSAVDISWLGHHTPAPLRDVPIAAVTVHVCSDEAPSAPNPDTPAGGRTADPLLDHAPEPILDIAAMQERYPLLRNAL